MKYGYVRVSSKDQNEARQIKQMRDAGVEAGNIFLDKQSGKDFNREQYQSMLQALRPGDEVYFTSLDRMGRNYTEIVSEWSKITKELEADIVILDMPLLDTRQSKDLTGRLISDIVLQLLSYVAQSEREHIRQRQAEGIAIAKAAGKYHGRKPIEIDKGAFEHEYGKVVRGECTARAAMAELGLKPNTFYKAVQNFKEKSGPWQPA